MMSLKVENIIDESLCSGCGLCAARSRGAVSMTYNDKGFLRPETNGVISKEFLEEVNTYCPGIRAVDDELPDRVSTSNLWGPVISVSVAHAKDEVIRHKGASGGVITALSDYLLATREVEFILSTRGKNDSPFLNETNALMQRNEVLASAGSRYSPSAPLMNLEQALSCGLPFAIVAKPCDLVALKQAEKYDSRISELVKYRISFFCAGVPSVKGSRKLAKRMGLDQDKVVEFRYRGEGWPGLAYGRDIHGNTGSLPYSVAWGEILNRHLQPRCKHCFDGTGEMADIACGDGWISDSGYPDFSEAPGRSVVLARTPQGQQLLDKACSAGTLVATSSTLNDLALMQPHQARRKSEIVFRKIGRYLARRPSTIYSWPALLAAGKQVSIIKGVKIALGAFLRARNE